jgi:hypothetical protein
MLSEDQLAAIYEPRTGKRKNLGTVFVRTSEGLESRKIRKMGDHEFGEHIGNVGTMRRSSKGRTYRMPNGSRKYAGTWWHGEHEVVAYKLKSR